MNLGSDGSLLIEGWRFIAHSYAVVNQFQLLELVRQPGLQVFHRDLPFYNPNWQSTLGLFDTASESTLKRIPAPPLNLIAPTYRIGFPYTLPTRGERVWVFGTAEGRMVPRIYMTGNQPFIQAYRNSQATIITPSQWSRSGFLHEGADAERVVVVPHGIDPKIHKPANSYKRQKLRKDLGWQGFIFLHIGAMTSNKGIDLLLKAFAAVATVNPEARLVLKGSDALYASQQYLANIMQTLTVQERQLVTPRLTYYGATLTFKQCAELYQAADVYVSPYRAEGFNLPVLEAMACGLPVICTQGGATDDFTHPDATLYVTSTLSQTMQPDQTPTWFLAPDLEHLVVQMNKVMTCPDFVTQAQTRGPAHAANYTWHRVVARLRSVLGLAPAAGGQ
ncbi:glycosyltransferase [Candidatus Cyanaurora vandensis]|uniref:glycosyltransferase n=1 Tax=Candidatus Cyanaurora vandensis TaxID=2714958 RepID=UPI00257DB253|nr:glycosyltransferase [Candidatus Cyanaurora vandensis]